MPSLGADMESAQVIEWLVESGDAIRRGDVIVVVETDKGAIEIEVFDDGVVEALVAPLNAIVTVGAVLARIRAPGEAATTAAVPSPSVTSAVAPSLAPMVTPPPPPAPAPTIPTPHAAPVIQAPVPPPGGALSRVAASPVARRRAAEHGIDLTQLTGHGPGGAITLADVDAAGAAAAAAPRQRRASGFDPAAMRRAIGLTMARAKRDIPHYYLTLDIDLGATLAWLSATNRARPVERRLLPAALLLRASGVAVARIAGFNGSFQDEAYRPAPAVHVGWAIALRGGGLIAPAVHDVATRSVDELMPALSDLIKRARGGGLRSSELMDATVTVTSLGDRGADSVLPIIYPPQVAMLGFGRIAERAWVVDGRLESRPVVTASLAADHRVSDGHAGGLLLAEIARLLSHPEEL